MRLAIQPAVIDNVKAVSRKLADLISQLLGNTQNVPNIVRATATSHSTANTPFTVNHTLGAVPEGVIQGINGGNARVYATDDDKRAWTPTTILVRCSSASTKIEVLAYTTQ